MLEAVATGFKGIRAGVRKNLDELDMAHDPEAYWKTHFWKAVIMYADAAIAFAHRYAKEARDMAQTASEENLEAIVQCVLALDSIEEIHLLPYHRVGEAKYEDPMGLGYK